MDMSQYLEIFIDETKEHLQSLNESLLQLEQNPKDTAILNEIFRVAHTLKGMAGTMGFNKMAKLTHDMENVLHALRNNEISVTPKLVDTLFMCLDALENYTENIVNTGSEGNNDYNGIISELNNAVNNKTEQETVKTEVENNQSEPEKTDNKTYKTAQFKLNQYEQNIAYKAKELGMNVLKITVVLNKGCVLKSARSFIIFQTIERHSEIIRSEPRVEDIEDEKFDFEFTVVCITKEDPSFFEKDINSIAEIDEVVITSLGYDDFQLAETEKISSENTANSVDTVNAVVEDSSDAKQEDNSQNNQAHKAKTGKTVRVDVDRLDVLMNLVSELIIIKTRLEGIDIGDRTQAYNEAIEYLERITTNLHDAVMKVRMVPVEMVFNRFPRMIRDTARDLNKEIILNMSGEDTELDRTVIDEIGDPLIHLLRNSADHGIESIEKRKAAGKPTAGKIDLRAYQDGNNVVIEVCDDGQGIDLEKVKKKAIEKGLVKKEIANTLSQKDIIDFLFKPSFSTSDKITDLSGRGVGLDVVKTKIEQLGGVVEVETEWGKGSKFIIRLPLTLAIIQALLVVIGEEKYAIPLSSTKEIIKISPDQIMLVQKQEVIMIRDTVIPIVRLNRILDIPTDKNNKKQLTVVIVKKGERLSGFLVDSLIGQQEIVIKSLGKLLSGIKFIAGATILGDGNVALILDVNSLAV
ncbi:chemotaxis protein CheA [Acetivibrio clariflavus]|uniref:Chemotaxis protein CheA n=1 Tax=Acetivibrio clariflavus (strain DSM 19732 / NBRC 101661 / EBR45) TaxID=720554 RepID=G8LVF4_ACECE|nr:chemotaxis protein CheA [Acetivibrio clariflavus]AEV68543.1 chemotaxis protein histidine kinase-like protein [Acetivibrio clariflavus DSM 19732]